ncbi:hypothetical protein DFJ74DRAFT_702014 [Hyaloraphidium curvatum]|nr:hypothetical protein DFJ74DRAFT_702014 [Hyaloraphidium curvatum]
MGNPHTVDSASPEGQTVAEPEDAPPPDIESLIHLESMFESFGRLDGLRDGHRAGYLEGRALGTRRGFNMGVEAGIYGGCAAVWKERGVAGGERTARAVAQVAELAASFPLKNVHPPTGHEGHDHGHNAGSGADTAAPAPSEEHPDHDADRDPSEHLTRLRSRFRVLASLLGTSTSELVGSGRPGGLNF